MDSFIEVLELLCITSFACSGALTAMKKNMDLFGVIILGVITSLGGGVIRDIILGITPPWLFSNPVYTIVASVASILIFLPGVRRFIGRHHGLYDILNFSFDTVGLAIYTVMGVQTGCETVGTDNIFLIVFVGSITGVGGGVLRDVLAQNPPYIFVKHVYALASIAGAFLCAMLWRIVPAYLSMLLGAVFIIIIRILAAHYRWELPHAQDNDITD